CAGASVVLRCGTLVAHMERRPCGETGYIRGACHKASVCVLVCFLVAERFALPHGHRGPLRISWLPSFQTATTAAARHPGASAYGQFPPASVFGISRLPHRACRSSPMRNSTSSGGPARAALRQSVQQVRSYSSRFLVRGAPPKRSRVVSEDSARWFHHRAGR